MIREQTQNTDLALAPPISRQSRRERETALIRCAHKDGRWVWLEMRGRLLRDVNGQPKEFISSVNDVTRRKLAEDKLAASLAELSLLAATDGLTGLANRRELDWRLAEVWRRGLRSGQAAALLMIDADNFKAYNDRYGHYQGDEVLRSVAQAIKSVVRRPGDLPARYGGEEFAVLLPNIDSSGALVVAEAVLSAVRAFGIEHEGTAAGLVTVSIGVVCLRPVVEGDHLELVVWADKALYEAKRRGRNCCVLEACHAMAVAAE